MFQIKFTEKITTHILCSVTLFWKSFCLWDNVEKYGTAIQATDENIILRMRSPCRINKATHTHTHTHTHTQYVTISLFHCKNTCSNAPQCYLTLHCLSCFDERQWQNNKHKKYTEDGRWGALLIRRATEHIRLYWSMCKWKEDCD